MCAVAIMTIASPFLGADPPTAGKVLVVDDQRILEGDIFRVGDHYQIRRASGETLIPVREAFGLVADRTAAYRFLRNRANLRDPDEHIRLAQWCQVRRLAKLAVEEAQIAARMRPDHVPFQKYLAAMKEWAANMSTETPVPEPAPPDDPDSDPPVADVSPESYGLFVTKIQAILMNTCASCHANQQATKMKLVRVSFGSATNHRATRYNLAAVGSYIDRENPMNSPLLLRALTAHGDAGSAAPIKDRTAPAFRHLEDWVRLATSRLAGVPKPPPSILPPGVITVSKPLPPADEPAPETLPVVKPAVATAPVVPSPKPAESAGPNKSPTPNAGDPFDPMTFNQNVHPNGPPAPPPTPPAKK